MFIDRVMFLPPSNIDSDGWSAVALGQGIKDPDELVKDPAAMELWLKQLCGREDLEFVRWDSLTCYR
jgi:hypothetical protein